jgi:Protein of unknown function (DUF3306)
MADDGFLRRWSRLKAGGEGAVAPEPVITPVAATVPTPVIDAPPQPQPPPPTMADAEALGAGDDISAFVARNVAPAVRRLAMKKLFADPHFQGHDGLDIYMGDYSIPSPMAPGMLEQLAHSRSMFGKLDEVLDAVVAAPDQQDLPADEVASAVTDAAKPTPASVEPDQDPA